VHLLFVLLEISRTASTLGIDSDRRFVCWAHHCTMQKRLNRSWANFGGRLVLAQEGTVLDWVHISPAEVALLKGDMYLDHLYSKLVLAPTIV